MLRLNKIKLYKKGIGLFLLFLLLLFLDRISKIFEINNKVCLMFLCFFTSKNEGVLFGFFNNGLLFKLVIFLSFTFFIMLLFFVSKEGNSLRRYSYIFFLSGIFGNFIDRVFYGYVVDWIEFSFFPFTFNLSDMYLILGFILFIWAYFFPCIGRNNVSHNSKLTRR